MVTWFHYHFMYPWNSSYTRIKSLVNKELKQYIRPEFLNQLDEMIVFRQLTKTEVKEIAYIMLKEVFERLKTKEIGHQVTERFTDRVVDEGYSPSYDAMQGLEKKMVRKPYAGVGAGAGAGAALGMLTGFTAPITMPVMATFAARLGTTPGQSMVDNADSLSYSDSERGQHKDTEHALAVSRSTYVTFSGGKFINKLTFVWSDQRTQWNKNYHISVGRANCPNQSKISFGVLLNPPGR